MQPEWSGFFLQRQRGEVRRPDPRRERAGVADIEVEAETLVRERLSAWTVLRLGGVLTAAPGGAGMASMLLFQLTVNVGMVIGVMPVTGIPLPFITHGGASLISTAVGLGILQSINMHQRRAEW